MQLFQNPGPQRETIELYPTSPGGLLLVAVYLFAKLRAKHICY